MWFQQTANQYTYDGDVAKHCTFSAEDEGEGSREPAFVEVFGMDLAKLFSFRYESSHFEAAGLYEDARNVR